MSGATPLCDSRFLYPIVSSRPVQRRDRDLVERPREAKSGASLFTEELERFLRLVVAAGHVHGDLPSPWVCGSIETSGRVDRQ